MARSTPTQWTRLIRFRAQEDHQIYFGQPIDHNLDVGQAFANRQPIRVAVLSTSAPEASIELLAAGYPNSSNIKTVADLLAPLTRTQVGTIRALGANYIQPNQDPHAARTNRPPIPILFYKPLSTLVGPNQAIKVPQVAQDETDYEVELLVVLGRDAKDVSVESALDYVVGYSLANDVSARKRMFAVPQWGLGKSFDTFLPVRSGSEPFFLSFFFSVPFLSRSLFGSIPSPVHCLYYLSTVPPFGRSVGREGGYSSWKLPLVDTDHDPMRMVYPSADRSRDRILPYDPRSGKRIADNPSQRNDVPIGSDGRSSVECQGDNCATQCGDHLGSGEYYLHGYPPGRRIQTVASYLFAAWRFGLCGRIAWVGYVDQSCGWTGYCAYRGKTVSARLEEANTKCGILCCYPLLDWFV